MAKFKRQFTNQIFKTMDELKDLVCEISKTIKYDEVKSLCGYNYIFWGIIQPNETYSRCRNLN